MTLSRLKDTVKTSLHFILVGLATLAIIVIFVMAIILGYVAGCLLFEPEVLKWHRWLSLLMCILFSIVIVCMFKTIASYFIERLKESYTRLHKLINSKEI